MVLISLQLAAAATAKLSDNRDRQWFLLLLILSVGYILVALTIWSVANRRAIKARHTRLLSIMFLIGALSPGMALLKLVYWLWLVTY